mgnify:FL=1
MSKLRKRLTIVILAVFASLLTVAVTGFTTKAKAADINLDGETFEIADKVSLKLNEDGGMRWILKVSDNVYNYVKDTESVEMGFVIAPKVLMDRANGDYYGMAQRILIPIEIAKGYQDTETTDTDWYFNGCVVKMNDVNRKYDYTAAAYIKSGDTILKQTTINTNSVNNFYNVANKSILYSVEDYSEKMLGLESYNWLGTEEFPIKVDAADQYNSLVEKINAGRDFSDKIIEIGKSVDRSGATLNEGYALPTGTREVCDGDAHAYTNGICVNCNKLQTVGVQYLENVEKGVYYVAGYTGLDKEVYVLSEYNGKPVTYVKSEAFANKKITKVVLPASITSLEGSVFYNCANLEYVSMVGVGDLNYASPYNGAGRDNNFRNCVNLKIAVVSNSLHSNVQQFFADTAPETKILDFYVYGASGAPVFSEGTNQNLLSGTVYYKVDDAATVKCLQWKYGADGEIVKGASGHDYVGGKCSICGSYDAMGIAYVYNEAKDCYYVGNNKSLNASVVKIFGKYDDGTHGEKNVTYITTGAFEGNTAITKVILPDSVKSLDGGVFQGCSNLEYVSMTGIENLDYNGSASGYGTDRGNNFMNCTALKYVILSPAFTTNCQQFFLNGSNPEKAILDIYVNAASGTPNFGGANTNLLTGNVYHKVDDTATVKCLQWNYGADGNINHGAAAHNFKNGICSECGKKDAMGVVYTYDSAKSCYYVAGYTGSGGTLNVFDTWNDGANGEAAVTYVKNSAFINHTEIVKVILPASVKRLEGSVFQGCSNLEYISMVGVEELTLENLSNSGIYGNEVFSTNNFLNCGKLKVVIVGKKFKITNNHFIKTDDSLTAGLADIYMSGAEGECEFVYDPANRNEHLSGNVYYYSETSAANSWRYVDGVATKW